MTRRIPNTPFDTVFDPSFVAPHSNFPSNQGYSFAFTARDPPGRGSFSLKGRMEDALPGNPLPVTRKWVDCNAESLTALYSVVKNIKNVFRTAGLITAQKQRRLTAIGTPMLTVHGEL